MAQTESGYGVDWQEEIFQKVVFFLSNLVNASGLFSLAIWYQFYPRLLIFKRYMHHGRGSYIDIIVMSNRVIMVLVFADQNFEGCVLTRSYRNRPENGSQVAASKLRYIFLGELRVYDLPISRVSEREFLKIQCKTCSTLQKKVIQLWYLENHFTKRCSWGSYFYCPK